MIARRFEVSLLVTRQQEVPIRGFGTEEFLGRMPSLGVRYLAAALLAEGHAATVHDVQYDPAPPLVVASRIAAARPDLVGVTLFDDTVCSARAVLRLLRLVHDGPVVVGGYTATFHGEEILRAWPEVDFVILREGERPICELVRHLRGELPVEEVPNLMYREGDRVVRTRAAPLSDVRALPRPARTWPEEGDVTPLVTRRGCSSCCAFCSMVPFYDRSLGQAVRRRDPGDVVDEIAWCVGQGSESFMLYDDNFGLATGEDRRWAEAFVAEVRRRRLRFAWGAELRVVDLLRGSEVLPALCDIGLHHLSIGMESLLPRQLALYNKGYGPKAAREAVAVARGLPADHQTNVIFWDPWSTLDEAEEHVGLLGEIGIQEQLAGANFPFYAGTLLARRGTALHARLQAEGVLKARCDEGTVTGSPNGLHRCDWSFEDSHVAWFHRGPLTDFMRRARARPRPRAAWLFVPRLERAGHLGRAAAYRAWARAVSRAEYLYFRDVVRLALRQRDPELFAEEAEGVHAHHEAELARTEALLPPEPHVYAPRASVSPGAGRGGVAKAGA